MALTAGMRLGPYEIVSSLGAGGMGEVYRARDTRLDRTVAIKVLPSAMAGDAGLRARFEREARAIAALDHPHICALHDVGDHEGVHFLVMQHLEGETLASRLARTRGPLPLDFVFKTSIEIADALDKAHRAGITHRDLKPANIMLTSSGAKLLDFGLAKLRAPSGPISMSGMTRADTSAPNTAEGTILGTIQYMSPEQIEGREADARSDIWALGAVIYEMATGHRPFAGDTPASVIGSVLKDRPDPVSKHQRFAPAAFDELVATCLAKPSDDRWQHVGDVKRQLMSLAASPLRPQATASDHLPASRSRWALMFTAGALLVAVVAAALAWRANARFAAPTRMELGIAPPDGVRFTGSAALSPDGKYVVFVGLSNGPPSLYLRPIESAVARIIPETQDASYPFWSPRGDAVGFFAQGRLKTIAIAGGIAKNLAAAQNGRGGAWGENGMILYVPEPNSPVLMIPENGGSVTAITNLDAPAGGYGHRWPAFIDDSSFLFTVQSAQPDVTGIYVGTREARKPTRLADAFSNSIFSNDHVLYVTDGMIVARRFDRTANQLIGPPIELAGPAAFTTGLGFQSFSVSRTGLLSYAAGAAESATSEIRMFDRTNKPLERLGLSNELSRFNSFSLRLSPSNRVLALTVFRTATGDLWLVDLARDVPSRFTFDNATELSPVWSPDGSELLYSSNRSGLYNIYRKSVSGSGEEHLIATAPSPQYSTDWSRDGTTIVFTNVDATTKSDIWRAPATGEWKPTPVLVTPFNEFAAQLSPDGKWMSYTSDESGRMEIYIQRFSDGGNKLVVSTDGGSESAWRADGRELFYLAPNRTIMSVPITTVPDFAVGRPAKLLDQIVDTSIGSMHAIHYALTSDGQRVLMNVAVGGQAPLNVVLNWPLVYR